MIRSAASVLLQTSLLLPMLASPTLADDSLGPTSPMIVIRADGKKSAVNRVAAELRAAGFVVEIAPCGSTCKPIDGDPADLLAATVIVLGAGAHSIDVWIADQVTKKTVIRHVKAKDDVSLALEVVELLRATYAELALDHAVGPPAEMRRPIERLSLEPTKLRNLPATRSTDFSLGFGVVGMGGQSFTGFPFVALSASKGSFGLGLFAFGPRNLTVEGATFVRSATTRMWGISLEPFAGTRQEMKSSVRVSAGVGLILSAIEGFSSSPQDAPEHGRHFSTTLSLGVTGSWRVIQRLHVELGLRGLLILDRPLVGLVEDSVGFVERFSLLASLGLSMR